MTRCSGSCSVVGRVLEAARRMACAGRRRRAVAGGLLGGIAIQSPAPTSEKATSPTVLVVCSSAEVAASLVRALQGGGISAYSVATAQEAAGSIGVLSVSLLVVAGPAVTVTLLALRQATSLPILAILPSMAEEGVLDAFAAGADDCQSAIIGDKEVVLRVRAMLRRAQQAEQ